MQDRVSLHPGRVKLVPVAGQENTYDMVRADSPRHAAEQGQPAERRHGGAVWPWSGCGA